MAVDSSRRVVITGLGQISPLGSTIDALWSALVAGQSGVAAWRSLPADNLTTKFAAEASQFTGEIGDFGPLDKERQKQIRKGIKVMCREIQMGVAVAQLALVDARLNPGELDPERVGVIYGCDYLMTVPDEFSAGVEHCKGGAGQFDFPKWGAEGMEKLAPLWLLKYLPNMPASHIAIYNDFRGPNNSITQREASANLAVGEAYEIIRRGHADMLVTGATGTRVHALRTLHILLQEEIATDGVDPAKASRPFDKHRTGMVLGEGAAALILERLDRALARGATIYGEVVGHASSSVAAPNLVAKRDVALANASRMALRSAALTPEQIGHIHAHGLSTRTCDIDEAKAIGEVFGSAASRVPVTAAKSYFGNLGAGSGMVELIASLLAIRNERLFPILNYETPDPECPVNAVPAGGGKPGETFINLNVTPQGQASAAIIRRFVD
jgi:3-oxoacyl-[acyl-carrier-protein] synthase II